MSLSQEYLIRYYKRKNPKEHDAIGYFRMKEVNYDKMQEEFDQMVNCKYSQVLKELGDMAFGEEKYDDMVDYYESAFLYGNDEAYVELALYYFSMDEDFAVELLEKASKYGNINAMCHLAEYAKDNEDYDTAIKYLNDAIELGSTKAAFAKGQIFMGLGMYKDMIDALSPLAEEGHEDSMIILGDFYFQKDHFWRGIRFYRMAIEKENSYAMRSLGVYYYARRNNELSIKYLKMACDREDYACVDILSLAYRKKKDIDNELKYLVMYLDTCEEIGTIRYLESKRRINKILMDNPNHKMFVKCIKYLDKSQTRILNNQFKIYIDFAKKFSSLEKYRECMVCYDFDKPEAIYNCLCLSEKLCIECYVKLDKCPICAQEI